MTGIHKVSDLNSQAGPSGCPQVAGCNIGNHIRVITSRPTGSLSENGVSRATRKRPRLWSPLARGAT